MGREAPRAVAWGVFAVALATYAWTAAPALSWLDAAEFSTAAQALAVAHPPGHPIPSLVGRLLLYLPLGEAAFRVNLASALAGALAVAGVYRATLSLAARLVAPRPAAAIAGASGPHSGAPPSAASLVISAAAALGFGLSRAAWEQAARAEVYALQAALLAAALAFAVTWALDRDARALLAATFATGLALANHHYVALCFFVPVGVVVLAARPGVAAAGRLAAAGMLGLAAYLYLPLRAARDVLGWGDADRVGPFVWTVTAQAFQKALGGQAPPLLQRLGDVATAVVDNLSWPVAALALVGAYALARRARVAAAILAGVAACGLLGRALVGFEPDNPDALGYLLPALAALVVLAASGVAAVAAVAPRAGLPAALVALAFPAIQLARFGAQSSYRGGEAADRYARAVIAAPPGALVITSYYETHFLAVAAQRIEGERPDVTVVDRNLLTQPYARAAAHRRFPSLAALLDAPLVGGQPTPLAALLHGRPVAMELAPNFAPDDPVLPHLYPEGALAGLADAPRDRTVAERADAAAFERFERSLDSPSLPDRHGAERILVWQAFVRARFYCFVGRLDAARTAASRLQKDDEMLAPLATCLYPPSPTR